ncbi:MAG: TonB-dependent receptor [Steroidobacteraceae bacterium]|jgi:Fe(3+) dicitrate transport protein|nr:TonB-dependent receptor [Steroidobacteraceae bacterium]
MQKIEFRARRGALAAVAAVLATAAATPPVQAQPATAEPAPGGRSTLADVIVIGSREALTRIPGSGQIIDREALEAARVYTINEALRQVPGVLARDEEGMGLRPNIGIRGLNPTRSSKVLLLEDGLPLAFAPYGDNATYYHPPVERFERIEVLKGAGQVEFGPQTVGGVINYITPRAPVDFEGRLNVAGGNRGFREVHAEIGDTVAGTGYLLTATKKLADGARDNMELDLTDVTAKFTRQLAERHALTLRASYLREDSDVAYSGLTLAEYRADPRQNPFVNDEFELYRWGTSLTHGWSLAPNAEVTTSVYYSYFDRDWWRQSSNSNERPNDASDPACGGLANLNTACGNQGRLRQYATKGIEPRLAVRGEWLGLDAELKAGLRYHEEKQYRVQANGDTPTARTPGTGRNAGVVENQERYVEAASGFLQASFTAGGLTVVPGLRYESVDFERRNFLNGARGRSSVDQLIPGLGATWRAREGLTFFAGAHRGFAPPRVEDIVSNTGGVVDLDAELSWNYELGVRARPNPGASLELTAFRLDFSNQIVPASVAGGSGATLTSAGETIHQGLEALVDLNRELAGGLIGQARLAWTWLRDAEFEGRRCSSVVSTSCVPVTGNRLPYAAENVATLTLGLAANRWRAQVEGVYTGEMYTDDLNTVAVIANGQRGLMPSHVVWNATVNFSATDAVAIYGTVKNVADRVYVVDMTRGLIPGTPRLVQAGFTMRF